MVKIRSSGHQDPPSHRSCPVLWPCQHHHCSWHRCHPDNRTWCISEYTQTKLCLTCKFGVYWTIVAQKNDPSGHLHKSSIYLKVLQTSNIFRTNHLFEGKLKLCLECAWLNKSKWWKDGKLSLTWTHISGWPDWTVQSLDVSEEHWTHSSPLAEKAANKFKH